MRTSRKALKGLFIAAFLMALSASSEAQRILPEQFGKWAAPGSCPGWKGKLVFPDTPVSKESNRKAVDDEFYCNGNAGVTAIVHEFNDPTGAYEFYTSELKVGMNATTVGGASAVDKERFLTLLGNYVVSVEPPKPISDADLLLLLNPIKAKAMSTPPPPIRAFLPNDGLIQGTQRYAMGPAGFQAALTALHQEKYSGLEPEAGFRVGAEAMLASYIAKGNQRQTLLLLDYATPQLAEQHLRHIQSVLSANTKLADTTVERKGSLLSVVLSPASESLAADLRNQINYETQVTWNEGSHTLTDPPWILVLKNIFLGTFAFCGLALVLGLAFGGVRILTKRFLPGKVFDRPQDMEVLQLGLSGKRIDPRDFY
ncbi:MAG TPA: DUF6599 family protein [Candidatus Acidoferrum sp.]|nr:DUF6599 family protein [Candidatus Acidoferrum sp.]